MVMGDTCTRGCRFCAVKTNRNGTPLDHDEPRKVAAAIAEMQLDYVVVTSVDRDDLEDQGSGHFAACIREIHQQAPATMVEVLIPDFRGRLDLLQAVIDAEPEVLAHNVETIPRLQRPVRDPRASWEQSLRILEGAKLARPSQLTKTSLQVGHGETEEELLESMWLLAQSGVDFLTIGQYLQPSTQHLPVQSWVTPDTFAQLEQQGLKMGFKYVASGPLVRSSYKAGEFFIHQHIANTRASA
jgi:lipoic acid synthetase